MGLNCITSWFHLLVGLFTKRVDEGAVIAYKSKIRCVSCAEYKALMGKEKTCFMCRKTIDDENEVTLTAICHRCPRRGHLNCIRHDGGHHRMSGKCFCGTLIIRYDKREKAGSCSIGHPKCRRFG